MQQNTGNDLSFFCLSPEGTFGVMFERPSHRENARKRGSYSKILQAHSFQGSVAQNEDVVPRIRILDSTTQWLCKYGK